MIKRKQWLLVGLILLAAMIAIAFSQLPPNWFSPDDLVNLSSVLTLVSFTVQSILALRFLAIGAQLIFIPYCLLQSPPLWTPAIWNVLFLAVNVVNVILLLLARRPVALNPDEEQLYNLAFKSLNPREFLKLLSLGSGEMEKLEKLSSFQVNATPVSQFSAEVKRFPLQTGQNR